MKIALINNSLTVYQILDVEGEQDVLDLMKRIPMVVDISVGYDPEPSIGWVWDGKSLVDPDQNIIQHKKITKLGLRQRMTFQELVVLTEAAQASIPLKVIMENLQVATYIDLSRPETIAAMNMIVSMGLLTAQRASEILNNPITELERYKGE